jgi:hypothetical protein
VATDTQREPADGCAHCELRRRAFLRDAGLAIAAAIVGIGTVRSTALAAAVNHATWTDSTFGVRVSRS